MSFHTNSARIGGIAGGLAAILTLSTAFGVTGAQAETLRLSHHLRPGHLVDVASNRFAEIVDEGTNGEVTVDVFPAAQITGLRQGAEAVQVGTVDLVWADMGTLANWRPDLGFVSLPFLFQDNDHFDSVFGGEVGEELKSEVRDSMGVEILGFGNAGFRVIATNGIEVREPSDLEGVRIRAPEIPIYIDTFRAVGANPTPMAWGEVYTALQTDVIEAVENPAEGLSVGGMGEVTDHLTRTYHIMTDVNLMMNGAKLDGLTPEQQDVIRNAAATAVSEFNEASATASEEFWTELAGQMDVVVEDPDIPAFQEAMRPVWDDFVERTGDQGQHWVDQVQAAAGQ